MKSLEKDDEQVQKDLKEMDVTDTVIKTPRYSTCIIIILSDYKTIGIL